MSIPRQTHRHTQTRCDIGHRAEGTEEAMLLSGILRTCDVNQTWLGRKQSRITSAVEQSALARSPTAYAHIVRSKLGRSARQSGPPPAHHLHRREHLNPLALGQDHLRSCSTPCHRSWLSFSKFCSLWRREARIRKPSGRVEGGSPVAAGVISVIVSTGAC